MRLKLLFLPAVLFFLTNPSYCQNSLNVMTFNIRLDIPVDSANNWQYRKEHLASQVLFHETNILGVQEAIVNQMEDLSTLLKGFKSIGLPRDSTKRSEFSAIFYDSSRLNLIEQNTFWLSENIHAQGKKGWDAAYPRIVTWGKFKDRRTKKVLYVFNTHFDHMGQEARRKSAHLLLDQIEKIAGKNAVIAMGDFNAHPEDEPIKIIMNKRDPEHLTDSKSVSLEPHYGPTGTFNSFQTKEINEEPIDYIFIKNKVRVLKHATLSQSWKGRFSSDHFPVFARIVL